MINAPITTTNRLKHSAEIVTEKLSARRQGKLEAGTEAGTPTSAETAKKKTNKEQRNARIQPRGI